MIVLFWLIVWTLKYHSMVKDFTLTSGSSMEAFDMKLLCPSLVLNVFG